MKKFGLAQLEWVINPNDSNKQQVNFAEDYLLSLNPPDNLDAGDSNNVIVVQRKSFENIVISLMKSGISEADKMTTFRFFNTIAYLEKQNKPK